MYMDTSQALENISSSVSQLYKVLSSDSKGITSVGIYVLRHFLG